MVPQAVPIAACPGGLQPSDAADTLQEVFEAVAVHLPDFRRDQPSDTFRGWLWTIGGAFALLTRTPTDRQ
jgi:hypothetical protein